MKKQIPQRNDLDPQSISLRESIQTLPVPLADKFLKYTLAAILFLVLVIIMLFISKSVIYIWGLIFPVFFSYLALSLVWDWTEGKIICQKMLCIKSQRKSGEQLYLIMKVLDSDPEQQDQILKFNIPVAKKDAELFTNDTILLVYYNPKHVGEMTAWEIVGNQ